MTGKPKDKESNREYPTWGGPRSPRPGHAIGRPPVPDNEKRQTVCVSLPPWLVGWLKERHKATKESTSAAVERALVSYYGIGPEGGFQVRRHEEAKVHTLTWINPRGEDGEPNPDVSIPQ